MKSWLTNSQFFSYKSVTHARVKILVSELCQLRDRGAGPVLWEKLKGQKLRNIFKFRQLMGLCQPKPQYSEKFWLSSILLKKLEQNLCFNVHAPANPRPILGLFVPGSNCENLYFCYFQYLWPNSRTKFENLPKLFQTCGLLLILFLGTS